MKKKSMEEIIGLNPYEFLQNDKEAIIKLFCADLRCQETAVRTTT